MVRLEEVIMTGLAISQVDSLQIWAESRVHRKREGRLVVVGRQGSVFSSQ